MLNADKLQLFKVDYIFLDTVYHISQCWRYRYSNLVDTPQFWRKKKVAPLSQVKRIVLVVC